MSFDIIEWRHSADERLEDEDFGKLEAGKNNLRPSDFLQIP